MNRKSFIKNSLMSLAIAMLPKILRPVDGEIVDDDEIWGRTDIEWRLYQPGGTYVIGKFYYNHNGMVQFKTTTA